MPLGKEQAKHKNGHHLPHLGRYYGSKGHKITPGEFEFQAELIRPEHKAKKKRKVVLDPAVTNIAWDDSSVVLSGSLTLMRPRPEAVKAIPVQRGHAVRLKTRFRNRWHRLWDMRVSDEPQVDLLTGTVTVTLEDDLEKLEHDEIKWTFKKNDQHPKGWKAHEVAQVVARKCRVRLGKVSKGSEYLDKIEFTGSGLEAIKRAYKQETDKTSVKYVIRFRKGKLNITSYQRSRTAYVVKGVMTGGSTTNTDKKQHPHTVIKGTARINGEKQTATISRRESVLRLGRSVLEKDFGKLDSMSDLKDKCRAALRDELKVSRTADLTIPGVPTIERGTTVKWVTKEPGWSGKSHSSANRSYAFVKACNHTVDPSGFWTTMTLSQHDPYLADQRRRDKDKRDDKRKDRQKGNQ